MLAVAGTLLCGLGTQANVLPQRAVAASPAKAYATARVTKIADGTGHGTAAQSFVNAKNGFRVGDNTKDDGVVSSGDTVEYRLELEFNAAKERKIRVSWTKSNLLTLAKGVGSFCQSGTMISAHSNSDGSCLYMVPAGVAETITQNVFLVAGDTSGKVVRNQNVSYVMSRVDGETQPEVKIGDLTIVSAPAADLVIDNGGLGDNGASVERTLPNWTNGGTASGYFNLKVKPLNYPGYNTSHGVSTTVPWETDVDVSRFPDGTTWRMDGKTLTVNNGRIHIPSGSGDRKLEYTLKYELDQENLTERTYDIQLVPDKTIFANTDDDGTTILNLGSGGQPGSGMQRDQSTKSDQTGAIQGYPYKNNDWSRVKVVREDAKGLIFTRYAYRPDGSGTYFEPDALDFVTEGRKRAYEAAKGTRLEQHGVIYTDQIKADCNQACGLAIGETWNPKYERYDGGLKVLDPSGNEVDPGRYWVEWHPNYLADRDKVYIFSTNSGWTRGAPTTNAGSFRVHFYDNTIPLGSASGAGTYEVVYYTRVTADATGGNITSFHATEGDFTGEQYVDGYKAVSTHTFIVAPGKTAAKTTISMSAHDSNGANVSTDELNSGDTVTYTITPTVQNIQISKTTITPTVTVTFDERLYELTAGSSPWLMQLDASGKIATFTLKERSVEAIVRDEGNYSQFSEIVLSGKVGNLTNATVNASAQTRVQGDAKGSVPAWDVTSPSVTATFHLKFNDLDSGRLWIGEHDVEVEDKIFWKWNIVDRRKTGAGNVVTVLHMPTAYDIGMTGSNNTGLDGTWGEYDLGHSDYHGILKLDTEPEIDSTDSTTTRLSYSTTSKNSENPSDFTWKSWSQLSASDKANITAIRVESSPVDSNGMKVAASRGTVTLTVSKNLKNDRYVMWIGSNRMGGTQKANTIPFPDYADVVSSEVDGTVWWDADRDALRGADETGIEGITVSLWKVDEAGDNIGNAPLSTTKTDSKGRYVFSNLHSGGYRTAVTRNAGTVTDSGVQTKIKSYYNQELDVENTRSWRIRYYSEANDSSDRIPLEKNQTISDVDFGFHKPDPKVTVDKTQTKVDCSGANCEIAWDVTISNKGNTSLPADSKLFDSMKENVKNVSVTAGTVARTSDHRREFTQVDTSIGSRVVALDKSGQVWQWGNVDTCGWLNASKYETTPTLVESTQKFKAVAAGGDFTMALDSDGRVWVWGYGLYGQLGQNVKKSETPLMVNTGSTRFTQIAAGDQSAYAVDTDGNVWAWGQRAGGSLGNGYSANNPSGVRTPTKLNINAKIVQITASDAGDLFNDTSMALALDSTGHIWAWGSNYNGALGVSKGTEVQATPVKLSTSVTFTQISTFQGVSCALDTTGKLWYWGYDFGAITGRSEDINTPTKVFPTKTFVSVSAGSASFAIDSTGKVWGWGADNGSMGLGNTGSTKKHALTEMNWGMPAASIVSGTYVVDTNGYLWAAGLNDMGQLGNGTTTDSGYFVEVISTEPGNDLDPTAIPMSALTESTTSGYTKRSYNMPYELPVNGYVIFHFTGVVERASKDQTVVNQAWFDSPSTPYSGTPNARAAGVSVPSKPDYTKLDTTSHDVTGNASCRTGSDYTSADMEHWFSTSAEDSCDQVGAIIPGNTVISPARGTISGLYWEDTNRDGIRQASETKRFSGRKVYLYNQDGDQVGMTTTGTDGTYRFDNLTIGGNKYTVQFSRVDRRDFTKPDANDSTPATDGSITDSDAGTAEATYGQSTVTVALTVASPNKSNVDAGVLPERAWLASMPHTGMGTVLPLLLLCSLASLVTAILLLRRPRTDTPDVPDEVEHSGE